MPAIHHTITLPFRGFLDFGGLLEWFGTRTLEGVDAVGEASYSVGLRLPHGLGVAQFGPVGPAGVTANLALDDERDVDAALVLARRFFDLDADTPAIDSALSRLSWLRDDIAITPGVRLPGAATLTESVLRAIVTQQVSVAAGRAQLRRLVAAVRRDTNVGSATSLLPFPTAIEAARHLPEWFRGPGARRTTIENALAVLADAGDPSDPAESEAVLGEIAGLKGIGPWTLAYCRLRSLGDRDADLSGDGALLSAVRRRGLADSRRELTALLERARPWRSYAVLHLWRTP